MNKGKIEVLKTEYKRNTRQESRTSEGYKNTFTITGFY